MKNCVLSRGIDLLFHSNKNLLIMKLMIVFLLCMVFQIQANTMAQTVTIEKKEMAFVDLLREIKRQTGYTVICNSEIVRNTKTSNVELKNIPLEKALDVLLTPKNLSYYVEGKSIVVKKNSTKYFKEGKNTITEIIEQSRTIRGRVTDEKGVLLSGISVHLKGTSTGTSTDENGSYAIDVTSATGVLVYSGVGFTPQEVAIENRMTIDVMLLSSSGDLDEVVVVGYGTQKKVNITGSISVVDGKQLENRPITNSSQALQGVQGVYVNQAGAQPGADGASIRIRGIGTIGSGGKLNPLVLVDGVEMQFRDVNPNDIESISVLKDAASTAIYGSRAANGVILITTKLGKQERTTIDYNGYLGMQSVTYLPDPVDNSATFMELYNQAMINQGGVPYYADDLINEFKNNPTSILYPNTNWMKELFDPAVIHEHNLRFSGATSKTRYNLSGGFMEQDGVLKGMTGAKKYNINLRLQTDISDRFGLDGGIIASRWDVEQPSEGIGTAMNRIMRMVPVQPVGKMENGNWPDSWVLTPGQNSFQNPLVLAEDNYGNEETNRILVNLAAHYNFTDKLQYQARGSVNYGSLLRKNFAPVVWLHDVRTGEPTRNPWSTTGYKSQYQQNDQRLNFTHMIRYEENLNEKHNFAFLLGHSIEKFTTANFEAQKTGYLDGDLDELNAGTRDPFVSGMSTVDALISYFVRLQYSYKDRYLFEANSRYDGSSRFAKGNKWGLFPSFSAGWRVSEEPFMDDVSWIDELKIRGSWGQIGNQEIGRFQYVNAVSVGYGYPFGGVYNGGGTAIVQYRDPRLRWETTTMSNVGLDWSVLGGKLSGELEYFYKRTDDILRDIALPSQVGSLAGPVRNIATVDNKGFEIGLNYSDGIGDNFNYTIGGHISHVKNKVADLKGEVIISGARITKEGEPIDSWFVLQTDGLFQTEEEVANYPTITNRVGPGDVKYIDRDNNGIIDGNDRYIAGGTFPSYTYGFNIGFSYKSLSLNTIWQGISDIFVRPNNNMASPFNNGAGITKEWLTDAWTPENPNARLPRVTARNQYTAENFSDSDFWLEDASYLRLKNIQLNYAFNPAFNKRLGISRSTIFVNAQNLLTFTGVKSFDPERDILATNIDQYPSVKMMTMGLNLTF